MIAPARIAAYNVSLAVSTGRADLPSALASERESLTDDRDRALASNISTGVQRHRSALDHLIAHFSKRSITRLDPEVLEILRIGAYQLIHLTRVPAAAVVDDAVAMSRRAGKKSAAGLVNAVLRSMTRSGHRLPLPARHDVGDAALDYLSITLSHPRWLVKRWVGRYGFADTERWLLFNNEPAPLTLRPTRTTRDRLQSQLADCGISTAPGRFAPDALIVEAGNPLAGRRNGFLVQDEASQLVTLLAGDRPGSWVLDTCASPGGKATAIAKTLNPGGWLVACDVRGRRIDLLRRTIGTAGAENILVVQADLLAPLPFAPVFDLVFVDAPCSGLGILRRDPDIRWRRQESDLPELARAQLLMLEHAAEGLAPGGRLVYATCSSEPEENEGVVRAFLESSPDCRLLDAREAHPLMAAAVVDEQGFLRTLPHVHGLEAFFGAVLRSDGGTRRSSGRNVAIL